MNSISIGSSPGFSKRKWTNEYRKSDKGQAVHNKSQNSARTSDMRKEEYERAYLNRPIVAVDGEGVNVRTGPRKGMHDYVQLAASGIPPLVDVNGLGTKRILDYLYQNLDPANLNVGFAIGYDINMWVKDLNEDQLRHLYKGGMTNKPVIYGGYALRWAKGKSFSIAKYTKDGEHATLTIYDVWSFFQRSFIQACDEYLPGYEGRDVLVREKARRGDFRTDEIDGITAYNNLELDLLVRLVWELRDRLNRVGLRPTRWNGPGAIASALFSRENIKDARGEVPAPVAEAARYAYAGGRFEMLKYGSVHEKVYEYDINSAYPRALLEVPNLSGGTWTHSRYGTDEERDIYIPAPRTIAKYGLYKVRYTGHDQRIPGPLFHRGPNGTISYPLNVENWVWSPEVETLIEYCKLTGARYEILEAWTYTEAFGKGKPFAFVSDLYEQRRLLKAMKDGAHVGLKLALNSMYGKTAQQVGWVAATDKHPLRIPPYHQLEWAGYVTSWCRAHVLRAAMTDLDAVIAFETDALFTSRPLAIQVGEGLGEWEPTEFLSLTYVQSGHYYATEIGGGEIIKCRGIDKGYISREHVESLLTLPEDDRYLPAALTRFYGAGVALMRGLDKYRNRWITEEKMMALTPTGKRVHLGCDCGDDRTTLTLDVWHTTVCPIAGGVSSEYPVDWINPNPDMTELTILREDEIDYE